MNKSEYQSLRTLLDFCWQIINWNNDSTTSPKIPVEYTAIVGENKDTKVVFKFDEKKDIIVAYCDNWVTYTGKLIKLTMDYDRIIKVKKLFKKPLYYFNSVVEGTEVLGTVPTEINNLFNKAIYQMTQNLDQIYADASTAYNQACEHRGLQEFGLAEDSFFKKKKEEEKIKETSKITVQAIEPTYSTIPIKCPYINGETNE